MKSFQIQKTRSRPKQTNESSSSLDSRSTSVFAFAFSSAICALRYASAKTCPTPAGAVWSISCSSFFLPPFFFLVFFDFSLFFLFFCFGFGFALVLLGLGASSSWPCSLSLSSSSSSFFPFSRGAMSLSSNLLFLVFPSFLAFLSFFFSRLRGVVHVAPLQQPKACAGFAWDIDLFQISRGFSTWDL